MDLHTMQVYHRLRPGEVVTVDNWRVLHGRTPIIPNGGVRHMEVTVHVYSCCILLDQTLWLLSVSLGMELVWLGPAPFILC